MATFGKTLIVLGATLVGLGLLLTFFDKIPLLGKLPGDIHIKRENFQFYFPIATGVVLSLLFTLVLWIVSYFGKK
jgi:hypothetical protein